MMPWLIQEIHGKSSPTAWTELEGGQSKQDKRNALKVLSVTIPACRDFTQEVKSQGGILVTRAYIMESTYRHLDQSYNPLFYLQIILQPSFL